MTRLARGVSGAMFVVVAAAMMSFGAVGVGAEVIHPGVILHDDNRSERNWYYYVWPTSSFRTSYVMESDTALSNPVAEVAAGLYKLTPQPLNYTTYSSFWIEDCDRTQGSDGVREFPQLRIWRVNGTTGTVVFLSSRPDDLDNSFVKFFGYGGTSSSKNHIRLAPGEYLLFEFYSGRLHDDDNGFSFSFEPFHIVDDDPVLSPSVVGVTSPITGFTDSYGEIPYFTLSTAVNEFRVDAYDDATSETIGGALAPDVSSAVTSRLQILPEGGSWSNHSAGRAYADGIYRVRAWAQDAAGNGRVYSQSRPYFGIDTTPPSAPVVRVEPYEEYESEGVYYFDPDGATPVLSWDASVDEGIGVESYTVNRDGSEIYSGAELSKTLAEDPAGTYEVVATDGAGHAQASEEITLAPAPSLGAVSGLAWDGASLSWTNPSTGGATAIAEIELHVPAMGDSNAQNVPLSVDLTAETVNTVAVWDLVEAGAVDLYKNSAYPMQLIVYDNYGRAQTSDSFAVEVANVPFGSGADEAITGSAVSSQGAYLNTVPGIALSGAYDGDGDRLTFSFYDRAGGDDEWRLVAEDLSGPTEAPEEWLNDGVWEWYVVVREHWDHDDDPETAEQTDATMTTRWPTEGGYRVVWDTQAPAGSTTAPEYSSDGSVSLTVNLNATESLGSGVAALAVGNEGTDGGEIYTVFATGGAGEGDADYEVAQPDATIVSALQAGATVLQVLPPEGEDILSDGASIAIPWWRVAVEEGDREIDVTLTDRAGNESESVGAVTIVDTTPPADPTFVAYEHEPTEQLITVTYAITDEEGAQEYGAQIEYQLDGTWQATTVSTTALPDGGMGVYGEIAVDGIGADVPIGVRMWLTDPAGNESDRITPPGGGVYTLPTSGQVSAAVSTGFDDERRYLELSLAERGENHGHVVTIYAHDPEDNPDEVAVHIETWEVDPEATVEPYVWVESDTTIEPHGDYWVVIRGINGTGDVAVNAADAVAVTIPNIAPAEPTLGPPDMVEASSYTPAEVGSTWWIGGAFGVNLSSAPATDADGDQLTYTLSVYSGSGDEAIVSESAVPFAGETTVSVAIPDGVENETELVWYLAAYDGWGDTVVSQNGYTVRYDGEAPTTETVLSASITETGEAFVVPTYEDFGSGFDVVMLLLDAPEEPESQTIETGSGTSVQLPEGRYTLTVTGRDRVGNTHSFTERPALIDRTAPVATPIVPAPGVTGREQIAVQLRWEDFGGESPYGAEFVAGMRAVEYAYVDASGEEPQVDAIATVRVSGTTPEAGWSVGIPVPTERAAPYWLAVRPVDALGNSGAWTSAGSVVVDRSAPQIEDLTLTGGAWAEGFYWTGDPGAIDVAVTATDATAVRTVIDWYDEAEEEFDPQTGDPGVAITMVVSAIDAAGNTSYRRIPVVWEDIPGVDSFAVEPTDALEPGQRALLTIASTSVGVDRLGVALMDPSGEEVALTVPGGAVETGRFWIEWRGATERTISVGVPDDLTTGSYTWSVVARSVTGRQSDEYRIVAAITGTPSLELLLPDGVVTNEAESLRFGWRVLNDAGDAVSTLAYALSDDTGVLAEATVNVGDGMSEGAIQIDGLALAHGERYVLTATVDRETETALTAERTIEVDLRAPVIDTTVTETAAWAVPEDLALRWRASDADSGIASAEAWVVYLLANELEEERYTALWNACSSTERSVIESAYALEENRYRLRETADADAVMAIFARHPQRAGDSVYLAVQGSDGATGVRALLNRDDVGADRGLVGGDRVQVALEVADAAGNRSSWSGGSVTIDTTAPEEALLFDGTYAARPDAELSFVYGAPRDPESGIAKVEWAVQLDATDPDTIAAEEWQEIEDGFTGGTVFIPPGTVNLTHGDTLYLALRTTNGAGLQRIRFTDGVMIDETAPVMPAIAISGGGADGGIYYAPGGDATLTATVTNMADVESGIDEVAWTVTTGDLDELERIDELPWVVIDGETGADEYAVIAGIDGPWAPDAGYPSVVLVRATNGVGLAVTGMSVPVVADTQDPTVTAVWAHAAHERAEDEQSVTLGNVHADWQVSAGGSPVVDHRIEILHGAQTVATLETGPDASYTETSSAVLDTLEGGWYDLRVTAIAASGRTGSVVAEELLVVDRLLPTVAFDRIRPVYPGFVDTVLRLSAKAEGVGASGYATMRYEAGAMEDPQLLSGSWVSAETEETVDIDGFDALSHGEYGYVAFEVQNGVGIWAHTAHPLLAVDHVDPVVSAATANEYVNAADAGVLGGVTITAADEGGGVAAYAFTIRDEEGAVFHEEERTITDAPQLDGSVADWQLQFAGPDQAYEVVIEAIDAVGRRSDEVAVPFLVDTVVPTVTFDVSEWLAEVDDPTAAVINEQAFTIPYAVSEASAVGIRLEGPGGTVDMGGTVNYEADGSGVFDLGFLEDGYGSHRVVAEATDPAGNLGIYEAAVRYNRPPGILLAMETIDTRPGMPLTLPGIAPYDLDGDALHEVVWEYGDGALESRVWSEGDAWVHSYLHEDPINDATTLYPAVVRITDIYGAVSEPETVAVYVRNTTIGTLYVDEYWHNQHSLDGEVVVPDGLTLTIRDGTNLLAAADGVIRVLGALLVTDDTDAEARLSAADDPMWGGIFVEPGGNVQIEGATIERAHRGITTTGGTTSLTDVTLADNEVGAHVLGGDVRIEESRIVNSIWYGIKEDAGGRPVVIDTLFDGNGYDYYADGIPLVDMEWINSQEGNGGNRHE